MTNEEIPKMTDDELNKFMLAGFWTNNRKIIPDNLTKEKPCHILGFCPYGAMVEAFELRPKNDPKISCNLFGHDCPVFYNAEDLTEDKPKGE